MKVGGDRPLCRLGLPISASTSDCPHSYAASPGRGHSLASSKRFSRQEICLGSSAAQAEKDQAPTAERDLDIIQMNHPLPIRKIKAEFARMRAGGILSVKYMHEPEMSSRQRGTWVIQSEIGDDHCLTWIQTA